MSMTVSSPIDFSSASNVDTAALTVGAAVGAGVGASVVGKAVGKAVAVGAGVVGADDGAVTHIDMVVSAPPEPSMLPRESDSSKLISWL